MLYITFPLAALIDILAPVALAIWLMRQAGGRAWGLVGVGALTFIGSQVVHLPLNWALVQMGVIAPGGGALLRTAIVLGLSAGLSEETARAIAYALLKGRARTWRAAMLLGAGHGGIESIILGLLVLLQFIAMVVIQTVGLNRVAPGLSAQDLALAQNQIAAYWALPWHVPLAGAVERLSAIALHLSLSVLVLQAFTRRNVLYYFLAVGWHALVDALAVYLANMGWGIWAIEALLVLFGLTSLGIVLALRHSPYDVEPATAPAPVPPPTDPSPPPPDSTEATDEQLERSKFDG